jgi:hypothetical protein
VVFFRGLSGSYRKILYGFAQEICELHNAQGDVDMARWEIFMRVFSEQRGGAHESSLPASSVFGKTVPLFWNQHSRIIVALFTKQACIPSEIIERRHKEAIVRSTLLDPFFFKNIDDSLKYFYLKTTTVLNKNE